MPSMMNSAMPKVKVPSASANSPFFICSCESILSLKNSFSLILCLCKTIVSSIILQFLFDVIFRNRCFGNGGFECKGNKNAWISACLFANLSFFICLRASCSVSMWQVLKTTMTWMVSVTFSSVMAIRLASWKMARRLRRTLGRSVTWCNVLRMAHQVISINRERSAFPIC